MGTLELAVLTSLLDLEGYEVVAVKKDRVLKVRRLSVVPTEVACLCPRCNRATADRHTHRDLDFVDLPMGGWKTELVVREWQFYCEVCDKFFTPCPKGFAEGTYVTMRLLDRLAELVKQGDVSSAAKFFGLPEKTAERWYYDYLERRQQGPVKGLKPVTRLGIDELSQKKDTASSAAC
jgi:transposase